MKKKTADGAHGVTRPTTNWFSTLLRPVAAALLALSACCAFGQPFSVPTYVTLPTRTGTTLAKVYFTTSPLQQMRVVGCIGTSDKAGSVFSFTTGTTPQSISLSNAAGTTITVANTNGITAADVLVIEGVNGITNATVSSFTGTTNIVLSSAVGWATLPGDQVYKMGTATTIPCGAASQNYQGDALFVGGKGRPVMMQLDGTSACTISSLTARYE